MEIRNLNINTNQLKKGLYTIAIATSLSTLTLSGCSFESNKEIVEEKTSKTKTFDVGEHVISIPLNDDPRKKKKQYTYHYGYKCIGIGLSAYGKYSNIYGGGCILYINTVPVKCKSTGVNENNKYEYEKFGKTKEKKIENDNQTFTTKDFEVGEHIISVPLKRDPRNEKEDYKFHDGYEIVDVAISASGSSSNSYAGGCILYINNEPVRCDVTSENNAGKKCYEDFGTPIEKNKVKEK